MLAKAESELSNRLFFWCYGCCIQRCPPQVLTVVGDDGVLLRLQPYWLHQTHHAGHLSSTRMTDLEDFRTCAVVLAAENTKISEGYKTRGMANAFLRVWEEAARDLHAASSIEYDDGGAPLEVWQLWKLREERKLSVTGFIVVPTHTGDFRIKVATRGVPGRSFPTVITFMVVDRGRAGGRALCIVRWW
ncbi:uncharacterized protein [Lolium perenne]|uniref:uncharacterized protein isoform X3 n=1 Tax=Lolium perenne TaxID=4522 RepID=UPI0021F62A8C|nr:uncharacterized protein LOC127325552 isoform X3 [Lolium perenne]XP_051208305.1 uncharacterized protein LOC127325552 isoform X3 [Lolium perenne]